MRKHNIGCVVNATGNIPFPVWKNDLKKIRVAINDVCDENIYEHFDRVADFINESCGEGLKTLVHCKAGISRSSSLVIAYLMKYQRLVFTD